MSATALDPPSHSFAQRFDALQKANSIRMRRAQLKRDLKGRRVRASEILCSPPEWAGTMKVQSLLLAVPKWGTVKVAVALRRADVSPSKTLAGLSLRQREMLLSVIESREEFGGWR